MTPDNVRQDSPDAAERGQFSGRKLAKKRRALLRAGILIPILILISGVVLFLDADAAMDFLARHRYLLGIDLSLMKLPAGSPSEDDEGADGLRRLKLQLSLSDLAYFDSSDGNPARAGQEQAGWRKAALKIGGEVYKVRIRRAAQRQSYTIRTTKYRFFDSMRLFDVCIPAGISYREVFHLYDLADRLGIYHPRIELVRLEINGIDRGRRILRQAYDRTFLEEKDPGGIVLRASSRGGGGQYVYVNDVADNPRADAHIAKFFELLKQNDPHLLLKYFDLDYMAGLCKPFDKW